MSGPNTMDSPEIALAIELQIASTLIEDSLMFSSHLEVRPGENPVRVWNFAIRIGVEPSIPTEVHIAMYRKGPLVSCYSRLNARNDTPEVALQKISELLSTIPLVRAFRGTESDRGVWTKSELAVDFNSALPVTRASVRAAWATVMSGSALLLEKFGGQLVAGVPVDLPVIGLPSEMHFQSLGVLMRPAPEPNKPVATLDVEK